MPKLSDEQRMQAAVGLSAGRPDEDAERIRRWGTQRAIALRVVLVLGAAVAGLAIGMLLLAGGPERTRSAIPGWREGLATTSSITGVVVVVTALIWLFASGQFRSGWRSPLFALTWRQRRTVRQQVIGKIDVDPGQLPAAREVAGQMSRGWPQVLNMAGLQLIWLSNALTTYARWQWALCALLAVTVIIVAIQTSRENAVAHRFLVAHPAPTAEPSGG